MKLADLFEAVYRLDDLDKDRAFEIFRASYERETGKAWSRDKFLSRASNWKFYGDENGFVAVRLQQSGMKKLVAAAGNPISVLKGLNELLAEGGPIWGAVSDRLARAAQKLGFIVPHLVTGGRFMIRAVIATIPSYVFGGNKVEVQKDGAILFDSPDTGLASKYLIGNKEYFYTVAQMPHVAEALKRVPGVGTFLRLIGVNLNKSDESMRINEIFAHNMPRKAFGRKVDPNVSPAPTGKEPTDQYERFLLSRARECDSLHDFVMNFHRDGPMMNTDSDVVRDRWTREARYMQSLWNSWVDAGFLPGRKKANLF